METLLLFSLSLSQRETLDCILCLFIPLDFFIFSHMYHPDMQNIIWFACFCILYDYVTHFLQLAFLLTNCFSDLSMLMWALVIYTLFSLMPPNSSCEYAIIHLSFLLRRTFADVAGFTFRNIWLGTQLYELLV